MGVVAGPADLRRIEARGEAPSSASDARVRAIDAALADAISRTVEDMVPADARQRHRKDLTDGVIRRARLYVASFRVLEEEDAECRVALRLAAEVDVDKIRARLVELGVETGPTTTAPATSSKGRPRVVVLLHGFLMQPSDLAPFAHSLMVPGWFLFPEGPISISATERAWWYMDPIARAEAIARGPRDFAELHPPDLGEARERLDRFLDAIACDELVLGGFSQGGMLAVDALLRSNRRASALALLSSLVEPQPTQSSAASRKLAVTFARVRGLLAMTHGRAIRRGAWRTV